MSSCYRLIGLCVILAATTCGLAEDARPVVVLHAQATVDAPEVLLGQIADVQAPEELKAKLSEISLGSGPVPGGERTIEAGYIKLRLRRFGIDPADVDLQGDKVTVASAKAVVEQAAAPLGLTRTPGQPLTTSGLENVQPPLVKRNQLVAVLVQCGGVIVHTSGRVMADAAAGDVVKVVLENSSRSLIARVTGPGETTCLIARSMP